MPHRVDIHVGKRLRQRRWVLDATQKQIAEEIGIRYQQLQKYETGANRMSVSRLWDLAAALKVPVSYFFDGMPPSERSEAGDMNEAVSPAVGTGAMGEREAAEMVRAFAAIPTLERQRLLELAQALSATRGPADGKAGRDQDLDE